MKGPSAAAMLGFACCCFLASVSLSSGDESIYAITHISDDKIKSVKDEVEFNCTVKNPANYPILWYKLDKDQNDRSLLSNDESLVIRDSRFSIKYDNASSTISLKIKDLKESDTGFYACQIQVNFKNKPTLQVQLQINRPPKISQNVTRVVNVTEGNLIELRCHADGFPLPSISWERENNQLLSIGGAIYRGDVLRIPNSHRDDRGVYYCNAENGVGTADRANVSVLVDFAPVVTAVRPRVGQHPGYNVGLECRIEAHPAPTVSWYLGDRELRKELTSPGADEFVDTYYRYSVGGSDYGIYTCRAENRHGKAEAKIDLFETVVPVCDSSCG